MYLLCCCFSFILRFFMFLIAQEQHTKKGIRLADELKNESTKKINTYVARVFPVSQTIT